MSIEDFLHPLLAAYINSPQWLKASVGRVYALVPASWRHGPAYGRYLAEAGVSDPVALKALSRSKLASTLRWAIETVPAYATYRHLLAQLDDPEAVLRQLPFTSKDAIKQAPEAYLSTAMEAKHRFPTFTGGSTSTPMKLYLQRGVSRAKEHAFVQYFHDRVKLRPTDVVLAMRGRNVPTVKRGGALWMYEPIKRHLILSTDHLEREHMADYVEAMRQWKPRIISAFPSAAYPLARWLKEHPAPEVQAGIEAVLLFSENVYDNQKALLGEVFDCPVLQHYGHTERVLMAASMPDDERCFFWPQYGHFELVDPQGEVITTPGVLGEIVGTGFDNQVMPFVRYRTGDMAVLSAQPHPLLPGYPAVERIEGRLQEFLVCHDHRLISICTMGAAHFSEIADFEQIQYEQSQPGHFVLNVVTRKPLSDEVRARIAHAVEEKTQGGCTAEVQVVGELTRTKNGKLRMLVQHLDISQYFGAACID
ncbi:hypothetical protein GTP46_25045 [Duganella sp. FT135W]|uniref:Phenylacetate--CoA ligase family protein n=1 Tax=Duganella flavida TaxID=2692175 RepID=A0A6L8KFU1_9BURK|nr:phenylacetate--CoA ligase family protein [Duganella flavida]MYM25900.1 hypothetical protein [Duganella flavida]